MDRMKTKLQQLNYHAVSNCNNTCYSLTILIKINKQHVISELTQNLYFMIDTDI